MQRIQGDKIASKQDTNACENDVLDEWINDALLRQRVGCDQSSGEKDQSSRSNQRCFVERALPRSNQLEFE